MTPTVDNNRIVFDRALVLTAREAMGTETQSLQADVTEQLRESADGVTISGGKIEEDLLVTGELLLLFRARNINDLEGWFALSIRPMPSRQQDSPYRMAVRDVWMEQRDRDFVVKAEIGESEAVGFQWSYTRYPEMREVYLPLFDDPNDLFEATIFHQAPLPAQTAEPLDLTGTGWTPVEFVLTARSIEQSVTIDQCEILLEDLDREFRAEGYDFLQWQRDRVSMEAIDHQAAEQESAAREAFGKDKSFNVTLKVDNQETTRNKRIRPLVQHAITLFDTDDRPHAGQFGCSVSD